MLTLAWRNVWRNQRRSLITLISIGSGLAAILFGQSMIKSVQVQLVEKATGIIIGHIRVMRGDVKDLKVPEKNIDDPAPIYKALAAEPGVETFGARILFTGLVSSPANSKGVLICAVEPHKERKIVQIPKYINQGHFLTGNPHEIVMGDKLAEDLDVRLGEKLVVMAQATDGSLGAEAARLVGIYHTASATFDGQIIYVPLELCQQMLAMGNKVNDFIVRVKNIQEVDSIRDRLARALKDHPAVKVYTWREVDHELVGIQRFQNAILFVVLIIIFVIVSLGILNTLLMSLFERIREFGVLMAMGAKPRFILRLVLLESFLLGLMGLALGLVVGSILILYFGKTGLPLPIGDAISYFMPFDSVIYMRFAWDKHWVSIVAVFVASLISGLIPALRASRLKVAEALRHV
ncbi:MAG: ABC transporter permease [Elusimicrobia bacterium]|nr:ABC transporter permease [Elusimicrobiota bacterium]